jgi:hypothetical protein
MPEDARQCPIPKKNSAPADSPGVMPSLAAPRATLPPTPPASGWHARCANARQKVPNTAKRAPSRPFCKTNPPAKRQSQSPLSSPCLCASVASPPPRAPAQNEATASGLPGRGATKSNDLLQLRRTNARSPTPSPASASAAWEPAPAPCFASPAATAAHSRPARSARTPRRSRRTPARAPARPARRP